MGEDPPEHPFSRPHLRRLANAEAFAASRGWPLCAHLTIHFRLAEGFTEASWSRFQTDLFDKAARWLRRRGIPVAFLWTRENGPVKGPHLHCLLHLPHRLWGRFKTFLLHAGRFQASDAGGEAIAITGGAFGMLVPSMRTGALKYLSKTADCSARIMGELGIRPRPGLPVNLKRVGVSHTIAQRARREAGWAEMRSLPELRAHLNPASAAAAGGAYGLA